MAFGRLVCFFLVFLSRATPGVLCPLRRSIDVLEGEYFFLCFPGSIKNSHSERYTVNWFKESEGKMKLIQETHRLVLNGNFLEFWPAELSDLGNYTYILSNGTSVIKQNWILNVLKRSKDSCFNTNHLSRQVEDAGRGYTLKCSAVPHNKNVTITWYKNCNIYDSANEEELIFFSLKVADSGNYTCVVSISHARKVFNTTSTTELIVNEGAAEVVKLEIIEPEKTYVETQIGKEVILNCTAFLGYSGAAMPTYHLYWAVRHINSCSESTKEEYSICEKDYVVFNSGNKRYSSKLLWIKMVKEEDLNCNYTCLLKTTSKPQLKIFKLKKGNLPDLPSHVFTTGIIMAVLSSLIAVLVVVLCAVFRVDLVLFYRDITGKDDTTGDGKEYDAFVSYLKDSTSTNVEERKFVLEILPKTLEEHFGYKLCIFERDVSPGGAVVDDVDSFIDKSRRLIIILSQNYISDKVMYELESGLHKALVERKIKIILIKYMLISDYDFLPRSLELLPSRRVVKWKEDKSLPSNSRFWKKLRYLMPAKVSKSNIRHHNHVMSPTSEEGTEAILCVGSLKHSYNQNLEKRHAEEMSM